MNKLEKSWIFYDVGNSAFTLLVCTIVPIYFKNLASGSGISGATSTAYWGYAASISTVIIAILGPILGSMGDLRGYKKPLFFGLFSRRRRGLSGADGAGGLACLPGHLCHRQVGIFRKPDLLRRHAAGYHQPTAGGSGQYPRLCVGLYRQLYPICRLSGPDPHRRQYGVGRVGRHKADLCHHRPVVGPFAPFRLRVGTARFMLWRAATHPVRESLSRLWHTITHYKEHKGIFTFLLAFFLYIDGVYTIIEMATSYGKDVGISDNNLLLALLLTQVVAFPCAILFARLSKKIDTVKMISFSIVGYFAIAVFALQLDKAWEFWFLAVCVAVFQGGIQALSRSYFSRIVPKENANEFFGIMDIFGKGAAFTGTFLMGVITQITGHSRFGVLGIAVMFILGFFALRSHVAARKKMQDPVA